MQFRCSCRTGLPHRGVVVEAGVVAGGSVVADREGTVELVVVAAICALENFRSRFNRIFRVEPNGVYCALPRPAATVS